MTKVKNVTRQGRLISYKMVARKCPIRRINAGRIMGRLEDHLDFILVKEQRQGPANDICNWLVFLDHDGNSELQIKKTNTKSIYSRLISKKFIPPKSQKVWKEVFCYAQDLNWSLIWENG